MYRVGVEVVWVILLLKQINGSFHQLFVFGKSDFGLTLAVR